MKQRVSKQALYLGGLKKQLQGLKPSAQVEQIKTELKSYARSLQDSIDHQMKYWRGKVGALTASVDNAQKNLIEKKKARFFSRDLSKALFQTTFKLVEKKKGSLSYISEHLKAVNPENILQKGYCIPFAEKGHSVMLSTRALRKGMKISLRFHDGSAMTRVEEVNPKNDGNT